MALLNKPGVLLYNVALFVVFGTLFLTLKNLNLEEVTETVEYSDALKTWIFGFVGLTIALGVVITISAIISKVRKTSTIVTILLIFMWVDLAVMTLYTYFQDILRDDLTDPGIRWLIVSLGSVLFFMTSFGVILFKFPGKVEDGVLAEKVRKKLLARESKEEKPYCPVCRATVEKSFKYCPNCSAKFSD
ncbi:MAG: hypothetical protein ACMUHB_01625 [Thermoplasmatota archaeon]